MFHTQGAAKYTCRLLVAVCGRRSGYESLMISSGCMEVRTVVEPSKDEFCGLLDSFAPNIVYLLGEHLKNDEVGSLVWQGVDLCSVDDIARFFGATLPSTVYLEASGGEKLAEALSSKGIPYVIYWNKAISCGAGSHFSQALFSVLQSSLAHIWDAFQLGRASFRLYCIRNNLFRSNRKNVSDELGPYLLGEPPKINVPPLEKCALEGEESSPNYLPAVNIHHDEVSTRFLICGAPSCTLDSCLLGSLEDGLNALLNIEMRESKLHNRFSVPSPPLLTEAISHGVVAMQCELSTSTSAHISLLVSGGSQICFDDGLLESHIKNEIIENSGLVHALPNCEGNRPPLSEPRKSASIACGATVFEVCMNVPRWALQVLRQLAQEVSFRSLVVLGIASIQGLAVASFEKDDTERLLLCCSRLEISNDLSNVSFSSGPSWLRPPAPSRKRSESCNETSPRTHNSVVFSDQVAVRRDDQQNMKTNFTRRVSMPLVPPRKRLKGEAMMPIPRIHRYRMLPFSGICWADSHKGNHVKPTTSVNFKTKHRIARSVPTSQRKSYSSSFKATQFVSLNPLPLKKHDCGRSQIPDCSEEEFLKDLMDFLILRGHRRLIPLGGLADFPDVVLNAKRLDLYNLYKEVVSRGGFLVGNGINWKGQIFSKMRNHTITNKMTGVGNVLKRHYETYLLEYELAHDDIDGECCLLCGSGAAGDWVNCGMCGEWAHFGCDTRQGLGTFKDYAKTDGLEYVCPPCSHSNY